MKSVSFALDAAKSTISTGPITSRSRSSSSLVYESTSSRASSSRWSHGPGRIGSAAPCVIVRTELTPPIVGTGFSGSYA